VRVHQNPEPVVFRLLHNLREQRALQVITHHLPRPGQRGAQVSADLGVLSAAGVLRAFLDRLVEKSKERSPVA